MCRQTTQSNRLHIGSAALRMQASPGCLLDWSSAPVPGPAELTPGKCLWVQAVGTRSTAFLQKALEEHRWLQKRGKRQTSRCLSPVIDLPPEEAKAVHSLVLPHTSKRKSGSHQQ